MVKNKAALLADWIRGNFRDLDDPTQPFRLLPWQVELLEGLFRKHTSIGVCSLARSQGKSAFAGTLAAMTLVPGSPLFQADSECLIVASTLSQGRVTFRYLQKVLRDAGVDLEDRNVYALQTSANRCYAKHKSSNAICEVLGANPKGLHGHGRSSLLICDEPAQWPTNQAELMRSAILTGLGKLEGTRVLFIGTRPHDGEHFLSRMLTSDAVGQYTQLHSTPLDVEVERFGDEDVMKMANPSYDFLPALKASLHAEWSQCKGSSHNLQSYRALRLNQPVSDTVLNQLVNVDDWISIEGSAPATGPMAWGVDLGGSRSLSAVVVYHPRSGRLDSLCALPTLPGVAELETKDHIPPGTYSKMIERGELVLLGNRVTDVAALFRLALAKFGRPQGLVTDFYRIKELRDAMDAANLSVPVETRRLAKFDGAEDLRFFERMRLEGRIVPVPQLSMRFSLSQCLTAHDQAGNVYITKQSYSQRDDLAVAAVWAVSSYQRHPSMGAPATPPRVLRPLRKGQR